MDSQDFTFTKNQRRLLGYALCFLLANWDEDEQGDDLHMTEFDAKKLAISTGLVELQ